MTSDELERLHDDLECAYNEFKSAVLRLDPLLYQRWQAGGFIVDENIASSYPSSADVTRHLCASLTANEKEEEEEE